jgi:hypothetical protein
MRRAWLTILVVCSLVLSFAESYAACLACQCGINSDKYPVYTTEECIAGCAAWGFSCSDTMQKMTIKKPTPIHVVPKIGRPFDYSCTPNVTSGEGHITGNMADELCTSAHRHEQRPGIIYQVIPDLGK